MIISAMIESKRPQGKGPCSWLFAAMLTFVLSNEAMACAVCFGDPDSKLAKGAVASVVLLGCVIFCVLLGIAGTAFHWSRKARKLASSFESDLESDLESGSFRESDSACDTESKHDFGPGQPKAS